MANQGTIVSGFSVPQPLEGWLGCLTAMMLVEYVSVFLKICMLFITLEIFTVNRQFYFIRKYTEMEIITIYLIKYTMQ